MQVTHIVPDSHPSISPLEYVHVRSGRKPAGEIILDTNPRFTSRGAGVEESFERAAGLRARYVILPLSLRLEEARYYIDEQYKTVYTLHDFKDFRAAHDDIYIDIILLPPSEARALLVTEIGKWGDVYKEIWVLGATSMGEYLTYSGYPFVTRVLTEEVAHYSQFGIMFHPSQGRRFEVDEVFHLGLPYNEEYRLLTLYNKVVCESWASGVYGPTFEEFLGGLA